MKSWLEANVKRALWPAVPALGFFSPFFVRRLLQAFINESINEVTNKRPSLLLWAMQSYLYMDREYRKNLAEFEGKYVFTLKGTSENTHGKKNSNSKQVSFSATFKNNNMYVQEGALEEWDFRMIFEDADGLRSFLFSEEDDMLNAILEDKVQTDGNLNYLYKFGLMARHLCKRARTILFK
jgi:hypothetical protein